MLKIFRDQISAEVRKSIFSKNPDYTEKKLKPNSIVFEKKYVEHFTAYLELKFVSNRDCVIPNVLWSKLNRFPKDDSMPWGGFTEFQGKLEGLDNLDEVKLSSCEFGHYSNAINLGNSTAPTSRLEELFESQCGQEVLKNVSKFGMGNWREEDALHDWEMIDELFPNMINEEDTNYATDKTVKDILIIVNEDYIPYIGQLADRLKSD